MAHQFPLCLILAVTTLTAACSGSMGTSGAGGIPPGITKGAKFTLTFHGAGAIVPETYEVEEVRGAWVRATAVQTVMWRKGGEVWINLAVVDQMAIMSAEPAH